MKGILFLLACLALGAAGLEPMPLWNFKMDEGDFNALKSTGKRTFSAIVRAQDKLEWVEGRLGGKALYFHNDVNCKEKPMATLEIPTAEHYDFSKPFTAMCWFMPGKGLKHNLQYTIFGNAPSDYGPGFRLLYGWGALSVSLGNGGPGTGKGLFIPSSKLRIVLGEWNHVAVRYDGVRMSLFYNGVEVANEERKVNPVNPRLFCIGTYNGYAYCFNGAIGDFMLFDQALPSRQILQIARGF